MGGGRRGHTYGLDIAVREVQCTGVIRMPRNLGVPSCPVTGPAHRCTDVARPSRSGVRGNEWSARGILPVLGFLVGDTGVTRPRRSGHHGFLANNDAVARPGDSGCPGRPHPLSPADPCALTGGTAVSPRHGNGLRPPLGQVLRDRPGQTGGQVGPSRLPETPGTTSGWTMIEILPRSALWFPAGHPDAQ